MKAADLLRALRSRGYAVTANGDKLELSGPTPKDPQKTAEWLEAAKDGILVILEAERILGGRLK